jgi:TetR/AcrR family transcriptional regulator, tetracycline repressor protein
MSRNSRVDVVTKAIEVLDAYGLGDLSMRRLGAELGVQPSALYHHFANKQLLLAAVADEILARGPHRDRSAGWDGEVVAICADLRDAMLAYRDAADVVATVRAFGLGAAAPSDELTAALAGADLPDELVPVAARTLLHFVLGHVSDEQTQLQAAAVGAISAEIRETSDFFTGLGLVVDGIRARALVS